jgi:AcrR family transcriptional regulator
MRKVARPREFDVDEALHAALKVFWIKGFDGASLTELAEAMGIVRPSLHAAFGSKEDLYKKALDLYSREAMTFIVNAVRGETVAEVCRRYLAGYRDLLTNPKSPSGCFMVQGATSCGPGAAIARQEILTRHKGYADLLEQRFRQAQADGDLPVKADARALAECLSTIAKGMAVQASLGATREDLDRLIKGSLTLLI